MRTTKSSRTPVPASRRSRPRSAKQLSLLDIIARQERKQAREEREQRRLQRAVDAVVRQPRLRMAKMHACACSTTRVEFLADAHRNARYVG